MTRTTTGLGLALAALALSAGCYSSVKGHEVERPAIDEAHGLRYFLPAPYLVVEELGDGKWDADVQLVVDREHEFTLKPYTYFGSADAVVAFNPDGTLKSFKLDADTATVPEAVVNALKDVELKKLELEIQKLQEKKPSPSPSTTASPSPSPSPSTSPSPKPGKTPSPAPSGESPAPDESPTPSPSPKHSSKPEPSPKTSPKAEPSPKSSKAPEGAPAKEDEKPAPGPRIVMIFRIEGRSARRVSAADEKPAKYELVAPRGVSQPGTLRLTTAHDETARDKLKVKSDSKLFHVTRESGKTFEVDIDARLSFYTDVDGKTALDSAAAKKLVDAAKLPAPGQAIEIPFNPTVKSVKYRDDRDGDLLGVVE